MPPTDASRHQRRDLNRQCAHTNLRRAEHRRCCSYGQVAGTHNAEAGTACATIDGGQAELRLSINHCKKFPFTAAARAQRLSVTLERQKRALLQIATCTKEPSGPAKDHYADGAISSNIDKHSLQRAQQVRVQSVARLGAISR